MIVPEDYQFTDNVDVNLFTKGCATLLFGNDWKSRGDLWLWQPERDVVTVRGKCREAGSGWLLEVKTRKESDLHRYSVCCMKNGKLQDPAPNLAATLLFYADGTPRRQIHYTAGFEANPPDGSPSRIDYRDNGSRGDCWYMNDDGHGSRLVDTGEMNERIRVAKNSKLRVLCEGKSEIVALSASSGQQSLIPRELAQSPTK